jgi:hypothetical protein
MASRTFTRSPDRSTVTVRETGSRQMTNVGPGGGTSAPPERVEEDRRSDVADLSDGGAGSARHTGDALRTDGEKAKKRNR